MRCYNFLMLYKRKISLFSPLLIAVPLIAISSSCGARYSGEDKVVYTFEYNSEFRNQNIDGVKVYKDNEYPDYTEQVFKDTFPLLSTAKKSSNETMNDWAFPNLNTLFDNASNIANIYKSNDENILGWFNSATVKAPNTEYSPVDGSKCSYSIYMPGGPVGDVSKDLAIVGKYYYGRYGYQYVLNEAQYGIIPSSVLEGKPNILESLNNEKYHDEYSKYKDLIENNKLTNLDALRVFSGDPSLSDGEVYLAASMAMTKIDADRVNLLSKQIRTNPSQERLTLVGQSHGFTVGVDSFLYNDDIFNNVDAILVESNSLREKVKGSLRWSGGMLTEKEANEFNGNGGEVDYDLWYSRQLFKCSYGQMSIMQDKFETTDKNNNKIYTDFYKNVKDKVYFKANKQDWNIGYITDPELAFYTDYKLDWEYRDSVEEGHNKSSSVEEYKRIFWGE